MLRTFLLLPAALWLTFSCLSSDSLYLGPLIWGLEEVGPPLSWISTSFSLRYCSWVQWAPCSHLEALPFSVREELAGHSSCLFPIVPGVGGNQTLYFKPWVSRGQQDVWH